jgi:hypothetical protein
MIAHLGFAKASGVRTRPRLVFWECRACESDARTHRTPKALRAKPVANVNECAV